MIKYDAIIIGAGQAGPALAVRLANADMKVAIIERQSFGGTCVNYGCIPSKTLIASAYVVQMARDATEFGVRVNSVKVEMKKVKARKDAIVKKYRQNLEKWLRSTKNCTVYQKHARFEGSNTLRVGKELLSAKKIFINVGARAFVPPIPGLDKTNYFTNSSIMTTDILPKHLIIIGGSYIGLEFAQMYRRFGANVTVIEKGPRLVSREDADISAAIKAILEKEKIHIRLNAECMQFDKRGKQIVVKLDCKQGAKAIVGSYLLLAIGRQPNTDDLGIEKAGIAVDERGYIKVDEQLQTNVPGIWALGECNGQGAFTHTAYNDYQIVADNLLKQTKRRVNDRILAYNLYIHPPLGRIGMTETEVRKSGQKALMATMPMTKVKRAVISGDSQGFMKILVNADNEQILGAAILGVSGDEVIQSILDIMYAKASYKTILNAVHIHPTVSELIPTLLEKLEPLE